MRTSRILLEDVKSPDGWAALMTDLGIPQEKWDDHLQYGEFATIEVEVDSQMRIVGGRIVPRKG